MARFKVMQVLAASLFLSACAVEGPEVRGGDSPGGKADSTDGETESGLPLGSFGAAFGSAVCEKYLSCCEDSELLTLFFGTDLDSCTQQRMPSYELQQWRVERAVEEGRLAYDPIAAAECLDLLEALSCEDTSVAYKTGLAALGCERYLIGLSGEGETCNTSVDCQPGFACGFDDESCSNGSHCPSSCQPLPEIGEECLVGSRGPSAGMDYACGEGLYCEFDCTEENPFCDTTCQPKLADGARCYYDDDCQSGFCAGSDFIFHCMSESDYRARTSLCEL